MRPYRPQDHVDGSDRPGQSMESDLNPLVKTVEASDEYKDVTPGTKKKQQYKSLIVIMSHKDYDSVEAEYDAIKIEQKKFCYRLRGFLSTSVVTKWFCCCLGVTDQTELIYDDLTPIQKKHRIKKNWKKAKRIYLF